MPRDWNGSKRKGRQAEDAFQVWAQATEIHHKGWPDFLCVKDGLVFAVEVKSGNASLSPEQREVAAILSGLGVKVFIWSPESPYLVEVRQRRTDVSADIDARGGVKRRTHTRTKARAGRVSSPPIAEPQLQAGIDGVDRPPPLPR